MKELGVKKVGHQMQIIEQAKQEEGEILDIVVKKELFSESEDVSENEFYDAVESALEKLVNHPVSTKDDH